MKAHTKKLLPIMILAALAAESAVAQSDACEEIQGTPPGLYVTTDEGQTYIDKDGSQVVLQAGQTGFANETEVKCITKPPKFLDWPCASDAAQSRMFNTYTMTELESGNKMKEIVERYFSVPEVISPIPNWVDGEYHAVFPYKDVIQFSSPEYWYFPAADDSLLSDKRPKTLLISLFVGTNQVVVDNNMIETLHEYYGDDDIPITFIFNDSNAVPVSYFGNNVSLEEVSKAFNGRGIKLADTPMWWLGDYQLRPTIAEFEKFFDIPELDEISPERRAAIQADLEKNGFSKKPILVNMFSDSGTMAVDQPARVRVAASLGMTSIPTSLSFIEPDVHVARCGPGTPTGAGGVSGSTTPSGGAALPPGSPVVPPPPEPEPPESPS